VSVFVAPVTEFAIPDDLSEAQVERGLITFYDHHCRGCRLVYHRAGSAVVITATTSHTTDLFDFVPGRGVI
ncbi:MAG TPA: hypothetical protein VN285_11390, partial [Candidatus Deferrimicrobium sp.]|nr:hypothetical protein [Candidatus Deferrimicrobium sp.]